jgi:hypothetical protein
VGWLAPDAVIMIISGSTARAAKLVQDLNLSSSILVVRGPIPRAARPASRSSTMASSVIRLAGTAAVRPRYWSRVPAWFVAARGSMVLSPGSFRGRPPWRRGTYPPSTARRLRIGRCGRGANAARLESWPLHACSSAVISASVKDGFTASGADGFPTLAMGLGSSRSPLGLDPLDVDVQVPAVLLAADDGRNTHRPPSSRYCRSAMQPGSAGRESKKVPVRGLISMGR